MTEWIEELNKYSKNQTDLTLKQIHEKIEDLHYNFRQLWWNALYLEDDEERKVTRWTLAMICLRIRDFQDRLLSYGRFYIHKVPVSELKELYEQFYEYLKIRNLMI